jgi:hypothetical protein
MTADISSVLSKDGIDGLGAVPSVLEESRTDGTVDNTVGGKISEEELADHHGLRLVRSTCV